LVAGMVLTAALHTASGTATETTPADIEKAMAPVRNYDYGQSRKPLLAVETLINETHGNAELRAAIEAELAGLLESDASLACKQFVCRKLWIIGTDASVPALAKLLESGNGHLVEAACYALSSNPSPKVADALRRALDKTEGNGLIAVVNLLGERRDAGSAQPFARLSKSQDVAVAEAAIAALGKIATENAVTILADLRKSRQLERRTAANHASLQAAQELEKRGKVAEAKALYEALTASGEPEQVRRGARLGLTRAEAAAISSGTRDFAQIEAVSIFDGKTFTGWEGNLDVFRIEDAAIVAGTLKNAIPRNEFLCTTREYRDFELRLKVKLLGDPKTANAGIQIRSRRIPNHHEMIGYQADMGQHYWGCLYDESRRQKILAAPDAKELAEALKPGEWNEYVIRCVGRRIQLYLNGHETVDYTEPDDSIEQTGLIGLQVHAGPPGEAWYKDIVIKEIKDTGF
jgi:HEAT repeat protein